MQAMLSGCDENSISRLVLMILSILLVLHYDSLKGELSVCVKISHELDFNDERSKVVVGFGVCIQKSHLSHI